MIGNVYGLRKAGSLIDDSHPTPHTTYSGTKIENELALKADASALANYYTSSQVDTALATKANASDVYTKAQVDSALAPKADTSTVNAALALKADKSDTYTKAQVDSAVATKSTVSVAQDLSSGTKIGSVTVDGVATDLYAPADSGSDVQVTPVLTTGTTIATITVNGVSVDIKETDYSNDLILDGTSIGF